MEVMTVRLTVATSVALDTNSMALASPMVAKREADSVTTASPKDQASKRHTVVLTTTLVFSPAVSVLDVMADLTTRRDLMVVPSPESPKQTFPLTATLARSLTPTAPSADGE